MKSTNASTNGTNNFWIILNHCLILRYQICTINLHDQDDMPIQLKIIKSKLKLRDN